MKPPGKTNLDRMLRTAYAEMERIQITQDALVAEGLLKKADPGQLRRRDDYAGMVRLIEVITSDQVMLDRIKAGAARERIAPAGAADDIEAEPKDEAAAE
ncbi:hypothetical protein J4G43_030305 [Bradyrhizobium barranii subsp. barranii]|uniref:Uncharacterized protein n=1 Tax=Bradyrhizobium barranii subsp. barranii TaxID=2823807 RepID=A0A939M8Z4_9BRAD|nr:hypothetical protein [Bradyrhizobium barranii]UEM09033.1 hypothetical protein J4G43_030305 [Bradyrhizobium barranii subsp. barranii]